MGLGGGFVLEGYTLSFRGSGCLSGREEFLLREGRVPGLLSVFVYRENLDWVFVYELDGGYSLGEVVARGEGLIGLEWFVSFLGVVSFAVSEFFLVLDGFFVSLDSVVVGVGDLGVVGLVYCPLYGGDFWGSVLGLFGLLFRDEVWFGDYLVGLEGFNGCYGLDSFVGFLRGFMVGDGGVVPDGLGLSDGGGVVGGSFVFSFGWLSGVFLDWVVGLSVVGFCWCGLFLFLFGVVFGFLV